MNEKQLARTLKDQLNNITVAKTTNCAMKALDAIQGYPKDQRLAGQCFAFMMTCRALGIQPQEVFQVVDNVTKAALEEHRPEVRGIENWVRNSK